VPVPNGHRRVAHGLHDQSAEDALRRSPRPGVRRGLSSFSGGATRDAASALTGGCTSRAGARVPQEPALANGAGEPLRSSGGEAGEKAVGGAAISLLIKQRIQKAELPQRGKER
jgi:hypothetical protein